MSVRASLRVFALCGRACVCVYVFACVRARVFECMLRARIRAYVCVRTYTNACVYILCFFVNVSSGIPRGLEYDAPVTRYYERLAAVQARGSQASHQVLRDILREVNIRYHLYTKLSSFRTSFYKCVEAWLVYILFIIIVIYLITLVRYLVFFIYYTGLKFIPYNKAQL